MLRSAGMAASAYLARTTSRTAHGVDTGTARTRGRSAMCAWCVLGPGGCTASAASLTGNMLTHPARGQVGEAPLIRPTDGPPVFTVLGGPCTVSDAGRCVGMPDGYGVGKAARGDSEDCQIVVDGESLSRVAARTFRSRFNSNMLIHPARGQAALAARSISAPSSTPTRATESPSQEGYRRRDTRSCIILAKAGAMRAIGMRATARQGRP